MAADTPPPLPASDLLQFLDADPCPTFLIPFDRTEPVAFQVLLRNAAFTAIDGLEAQLCDASTSSTRFRSWAQAATKACSVYEFADRPWSAFTIKDRWKAVRATDDGNSGSDSTATRSPIERRSSRELENATIAVTRLESLQRMMEMSDVGVFEYHPSGTLIQANESWYNLSRHPREVEAHMDFSFMDLVFPADVPLVMSQWNKLTQGIPVTFEMRWKAPKSDHDVEGEEGSQWVLSACLPVFDNKGNLASIAGNTIDISAQKRVQREALRRAEALERARASELKFARFAELAPVAIYIFDPKKGMQYCNQQFFELTGIPHEDPENFDWDQVVYPEDLGVVKDGWEVLLEDKKPVQIQFRLQKKRDAGDGVLRQAWAQGQSYPECDTGGNILSVFGTLMDITKFKWVEDVQRSRVEEALEAKRQQENFIDMTSHEMRNPLSAVIQCADSSIDAVKEISKLTSDLISDNPKQALGQVQQEIRTCLDALQTIVSCSLHQKRVIDDILTLSKLDSNLILITPVRAQPAAVVEEAVKMFELECSKEEIELRFERDPSLAATGAHWVMMDPSRLLQILINLITNAIKFSRGRAVRKINVRLGASPQPLPDNWNGITFAATRPTSQQILDKPEWGKGNKAYIWITVQDTGCGLTATERGNIFTRFTQATPRTHVQYGGSGLGLFISKSLTELQSGSIGCHSEAGVGSTFAVFVGSRIASRPGTKRTEADPRSNLSTEEAFKKSHYNVLIVEDNIVNQNVLSRQLQKWGCDVHVAGHGEEALEFLKTTRFWHAQTRVGQDLSIVLMDVEMPIMDGLTCARRIRQLQKAGDIVGHIPILGVSANARSEQVLQALDAGIDDTIAKPFRIPELLVKMEMLASKAS